MVIGLLMMSCELSRTVVPKLGAIGAIAREPWAHIEKIYFSRIDTEIWTF